MTGIETGAVVGTAVTLSLVLADIIKKLVDRLLSKKDEEYNTTKSCQISKTLANEMRSLPETQRDILEQLKATSDSLKETTVLQREILRIIDRIELRLETKIK